MQQPHEMFDSFLIDLKLFEQLNDSVMRDQRTTGQTRFTERNGVHLAKKQFKSAKPLTFEQNLCEIFFC